MDSVLDSKLLAWFAGFERRRGFEVAVAAENAGPILECRPRTARAGKLVGVGVDYGEETVLAAAGSGSRVRGHEVGTGCANFGPSRIAVLAYFTICACGGSDARNLAGGAEEAGRLSWVGEGAGGAGVAEAGAVEIVANETSVTVLAPLNTALSSGSELSKRASLADIGCFVVIFTSETAFTGRRAAKGMTTVWTGGAIIAGPDGKSILRAKFNVGVIIRGLVTGGGSLAHWGTVGVGVLALAGARVASCGRDAH